VLRAEIETTLGELELELELAVEAGECLALAGPSGAGKSSVLRAIAGLLRPARGRISCNGETWLDTGGRINFAPERRRCGYLFQEYALFPHLSAWENVAYPLKEVPRRERRAKAVALLGRFGLAERADAAPRSLSGGERQRVALARALARRPGVLLLDEPLSALDARTRAAATREVAQVLRDLDVPAILVTHDFTEAAQLGDRVGIIDAGRIVQEGSASELASTPGSAFVADFSGAVVLEGQAHSGAGGLTIVALDGGGEVASSDIGAGRVGVSVHPWEITIETVTGEHPPSSALNRLPGVVTTITTIGNRVRLGINAGQPLVAEVTAASVEGLELAVGSPVVASWKAAATRLVAL